MFSCEGIKYLCRQCGKQFSKTGILTGHIRAVHEGIKYPCRQCEKEFSTGSFNRSVIFDTPIKS